MMATGTISRAIMLWDQILNVRYVMTGRYGAHLNPV
jgi:hypothetical protein